MGLLIEPGKTAPMTIADVTFQLRVMTAHEQASVLDSFMAMRSKLQQKQQAALDEGKTGDDEIRIRFDEEMLAVMERCLTVGISGWDSDAEFATDEDGYMTADTLNRVPVMAWIDLFNRAWEVNFVTEEEAKNSPSS